MLHLRSLVYKNLFVDLKNPHQNSREVNGRKTFKVLRWNCIYSFSKPISTKEVVYIHDIVGIDRVAENSENNGNAEKLDDNSEG